MNQSNTQHIGNLKGKILVFGGIYSNFQALQAIQKVAQNLNISPQNIINTGDVVAYCAQPEDCVQMIKKWNIHSIAGNVEIQIREGQEDCACDFTAGGTCDLLSKQWYPFAQSKLSKDSIDWMHSLPEFIQLEYATKQVTVLHGSYFNTSEFIFKSTDWKIKQQNFDATQSDVILAGHCGLPFTQQENNKYWLNAGVIGMPANNASTDVWYMILDDANDIFSYQHFSLKYDYATAKAKMLDLNLPQQYAKTLQTGLWDNCEILPEIETALQGKAIHF